MGERVDATSDEQADPVLSGGGYSREWLDWIETHEPVVSLTSEEIRERYHDLEPATEDDVPWRFPVKVPLEGPS